MSYYSRMPKKVQRALLRMSPVNLLVGHPNPAYLQYSVFNVSLHQHHFFMHPVHTDCIAFPVLLRFRLSRFSASPIAFRIASAYFRKSKHYLVNYLVSNAPVCLEAEQPYSLTPRSYGKLSDLKDTLSEIIRDGSAVLESWAPSQFRSDLRYLGSDCESLIDLSSLLPLPGADEAPITVTAVFVARARRANLNAKVVALRANPEVMMLCDVELFQSHTHNSWSALASTILDSEVPGMTWLTLKDIEKALLKRHQDANLSAVSEL